MAVTSAPPLENQGSLERLMDALQARLPGVMLEVARAAAWDAIEDFLGRSQYWSTVVAWSESDIAGDFVTVPAPADTVVQGIREIYGLSVYSIEQPDRIRLMDSRSRLGTALTILAPDVLDHTPSSLWGSWWEAFLEGALARLYADAAKPYANKELTAYYAERFDKQVEQAALQAQRFVVDAPASTDEIERLYLEVKATLGFEVPQTVLRQAAWNTIEDFYLQSTLRREHVYWQMGPCVPTVEFDPFDAYSRVAWILNFSGLHQGKVEMPSRLRDLTCPTPGTRREGQAWLALKPAGFDAVSSCDGPFGELWTHWFEPIQAGVLSRLCLQPAKPWSSPQLALLHGRGYRRGVQAARSTAMRGYSAGGPVPFPYYASGHQTFGTWGVR